MPGRNAFFDPATGYLTCHGFVESNAPGELKIPVPDDFSLQPYRWKWDGADWIAAAPPAGRL